jgi:hypothetical protein
MFGIRMKRGSVQVCPAVHWLLARIDIHVYPWYNQFSTARHWAVKANDDPATQLVFSDAARDYADEWYSCNLWTTLRNRRLKCVLVRPSELVGKTSSKK